MTILSDLSTLFSRVISIFSTYDWLSDTLDIILLTLLVYGLLSVIKDSRALTIAKGLVFFILAYIVVSLLDMKASIFLFRKVFDNILILLAIIFAPELRKLLEKLGTSRGYLRVSSLFSRNGSQKAIQYNEEMSRCINSVCKAAQEMSDEHIGALIIFERGMPLGEIIDTGTILDARITSQAIQNVFFPKSPLHDGATVIRNNRLYAAGCILPLTSRHTDFSKKLGTRHRAAIGMSEVSDAYILVVSEENGSISMAEGGNLHRDLTDGEVREMLLDVFLIDVDEKEDRKFRKKKKDDAEITTGGDADADHE
ncbi:MAG: diadenylate cyclase CdaA [Clostridia bacterium]|nr:diadenylate cyclase CdaA [Clostridia bacterium]MBO7690876.1 diadenylate cyclase CdaA [Clostridia bacterium]